MPGFWIATADATGARAAGSELLLQPAPARVDYEDAPAGALLDTADGYVVHQQPTRDGRRRSWVWLNYPSDQPGFRALWPTLEGLRSRYRRELGLSPYVYLKEDATGLCRRRVTVAASGSGSDVTFTVAGGGLTSDAYIGGTLITSGGQVRGIVDNDATTLTLGLPLLGAVSEDITIQYWTTDWVRARVLEVSRTVAEGGGVVRYAEAKLTFVLDDDTYNNLG